MSSEPQPLTAHDCWASTAAQSPGATTNTGSRAEGIAKIGTVISAIMASSCCWLPPILILAGVSGAGMTQALQSYRIPFMIVTFAFLGMAFYFTYRPRRGNAGQTTDAERANPTNAGSAPPAPPVKRRFSMMAMNKVMLWAVTAMAVVFLFFPQFVTGLFASDDQDFSGLQRSVVVVEGMTCEGWRDAAAAAIRKAPGVLKVKVDYESRRATVGTKMGQPVPREAILRELAKINYGGRFLEDWHRKRLLTQAILVQAAVESWTAPSRVMWPGSANR